MNTAAAVRQIKAEQEVKATAVASFKEPPPPVKDFAKKALKNFKSVSLTKVLQSLDLVKAFCLYRFKSKGNRGNYC